MLRYVIPMNNNETNQFIFKKSYEFTGKLDG